MAEPAICETCDGDGQVLVGFGIYSTMRPGIKRCPDCDGTGEQREEAQGMTTITVDEAEDIYYGEHVVVQEVSRHRWYTKRLVVFERDGALYGFHYDDPATEEQEGQDRFTADPVPVLKVQAREVTTTVYEVAP